MIEKVSIKLMFSTQLIYTSYLIKATLSPVILLFVGFGIKL